MKLVSLLVLLSCASAYAETPKAIHVVVPPLKTEEAKAATEIKRLLAQKRKEVAIVETADEAEFTVEVASVEKRAAGQIRSHFVAGQLDDRMATVITAKLCIPSKDYCASIEGDSSQQVIALGSLDWAAQRVEEKIRKAIR